jgi:hypothetical protein
MSATSNDSPVAHDVSPSQRPSLVPGSGAWGQVPHGSTYTWPSWPQVLPSMGLPPTGSPGYTWPPPAAGGSAATSPQQPPEHSPQPRPSPQE